MARTDTGPTLIADRVSACRSRARRFVEQTRAVSRQPVGRPPPRAMRDDDDDERKSERAGFLLPLDREAVRQAGGTLVQGAGRHQRPQAHGVGGRAEVGTQDGSRACECAGGVSQGKAWELGNAVRPCLACAATARFVTSLQTRSGCRPSQGWSRRRRERSDYSAGGATWASIAFR